ncbi:hypothetical protein Nit79A3_3030 [Nitrosomonas sp. Is79A3]|uniref:hypothetical protein n=1 Tax=Nitrosomonas sp. (strain Is79A3) TaxID=261292 RepID=UPI000215CA40
MSNSGNELAFDDADQLDTFLEDSKSFDKLRNSTIADARSVIDAFSTEIGDSAWPFLNRVDVANRLLELIGSESSDAEDQPDVAGRLIQQGAMNLCGPAAFFQFVIKRDPLMFASFSTSLFNNGKAELGQLSVIPGDEILEKNYSDFIPNMGGSICPQADWMVMGALRNATNAFWTGSFHGTPDEMLAAGTTPAELCDWLKKTGLYSSVLNEANWMQSAGIPHATGLLNAEGTDVAGLINADLIRAARNLPANTSWPLTEFPNHWVVIIGETSKDVERDAVFFNIWTWGGSQALEVPMDAFINNYYGAVQARFAF